MTELPDLLLSYGIALKKSGNEYQCLCYAHDDHTPSMSVYRNGNGHWNANCHACGAGGSVIKVYCQLSGLDPDAPADMAKAYESLELGNYTTGKPYAVIHNEPPEPPRTERTMLIPPADAGLPKMGWIEKDGIKWGDPHEVYAYRQPGGEPWYYEARWDLEHGKECRCFTWGRRGSAPAKWECSHHLPPRPLYGLDHLHAKPDAQAVICEGPRKAAAAQQLLPMVACIGWAGGANGWKKSDWEPLAGRTCILWPDADDVGREAMADLAQMLIAQGCTCYILDTTAEPPKWDARDALDDGWDTARTLAWAKAHKGDVVAVIEKKTPEESPAADVADPDGSIYDLPPVTDDAPPEYTAPMPQEAYITDEAGIAWPEPADVFHELSAPQVRPDMVPECIREWMVDTDGVKGVDRSMLAIGAIVSAAAVTHVGIKIQPEHTNPGWTEPPILWAAIVGKSGIKKSAGLGAAISRLKKIQIDLSAKAEDLEDDHKSREMAYEIAKKEYIKKLSQKDATAQKPERPQLPEIRRLIYQDATIDKMGDLIAKSPTNCLVDRDELSGWFASVYKNWAGSSDSATWLDFFEAKPKYVDRIARGSIFVSVWGGCVLGGIQPSSIRKIVENLPEDGLLQRFIPIQCRQGREGNEQPYNKAANDRYHNMLQQIFDTIPAAHETVKLAPEANAIRKEISRHAAKLVEAGIVSDALCSHLSKYEGIIARLMLIFHVIDCADKPIHPQSCQVSAETAKLVKKFVLEFMLPHAIVFYTNLIGQSSLGHNLRKIAELCLIADTGEISNRDMMRGFVGWRHVRPQDQEIIIQQLIDQGWILPHPHARLSTKGFPTRYLLNPRIKAVHAERKADEIERRKTAMELIELCRAD